MDAQERDLAGSPGHGPKGSQEWPSSLPGNHGLVLEKRHQAETRTERSVRDSVRALPSSLGVDTTALGSEVWVSVLSFTMEKLYDLLKVSITLSTLVSLL